MPSIFTLLLEHAWGTMLWPQPWTATSTHVSTAHEINITYAPVNIGISFVISLNINYPSESWNFWDIQNKIWLKLYNLFSAESFDSLPDRPDNTLSYGVIMHLISKREGTVLKINHEEELNDMESVKYIAIEPKVGSPVVKTVNIRTDSGYILLENTDPIAIERDYNRILTLQETLFEVEENDAEEKAVQKIVEEVKRVKEMVEDNAIDEDIVAEVEGQVVLDQMKNVDYDEEEIEKLKSESDAIVDEITEEIEEDDIEEEATVMMKSNRRRKRNHDFDNSGNNYSASMQQHNQQYETPKFVLRPEIILILKRIQVVGVRAAVILSGYAAVVIALAVFLPLFISI